MSKVLILILWISLGGGRVLGELYMLLGRGVMPLMLVMLLLWKRFYLGLGPIMVMVGSTLVMLGPDPSGWGKARVIGRSRVRVIGRSARVIGRSTRIV